MGFMGKFVLPATIVGVFLAVLFFILGLRRQKRELLVLSLFLVALLAAGWWLLLSFITSMDAAGVSTDFTRGETDEYAYIEWNGRIYIPYCTVSNSERGNRIGIVDGDKNDRVYEYKDYSPNEWIISFYHSGEMDSSMLMRETRVTNIPPGIQSEYDWNHY